MVTRALAQTQGAADRAEVQARLAKTGQNEDVIKKMLEKLPDESQHLVIYRWILIGVAIVAVILATLDAARRVSQGKKMRFPVAELATAEFAFIGWALAMPGTPLAAYHAPADLSAITVFIAASAALVVGALGKLVLTKPQTGTGK